MSQHPFSPAEAEQDPFFDGLTFTEGQDEIIEWALPKLVALKPLEGGNVEIIVEQTPEGETLYTFRCEEDRLPAAVFTVDTQTGDCVQIYTVGTEKYDSQFYDGSGSYGMFQGVSPSTLFEAFMKVANASETTDAFRVLLLNIHGLIDREKTELNIRENVARQRNLPEPSAP